MITPAASERRGASPRTMSMIASSVSLLYFEAYASISFIFFSNSAVSLSSPITLITFPLAETLSFGKRLRTRLMLQLLVP